MHQDEHCIFCKIVKGEVSSPKVWEDEKHIAFLSLWPNTEGFTVVTTKEHYPSYAFELPDDVLIELTLAAKKVGKLLDAAFDDVGRTALIVEGMGVNHVHMKLVPLHGTRGTHTIPEPGFDTFFKEYAGYISSHNGPRQSDEELDATASKIRAAQKK